LYPEDPVTFPAYHVVGALQVTIERSAKEVRNDGQTKRDELLHGFINFIINPIRRDRRIEGISHGFYMINKSKVCGRQAMKLPELFGTFV
jgi:hypothetical protein